MAFRIARVRRDRDVREAMKGRANFSVHTSISMIAACLWDCGEDELAERALAMSADDHAAIQRIQAVYEDRNYPLPVEGQRITHRHVAALAAVAYFEGSLRPLARARRRPQKQRPARFTPEPPSPLGERFEEK
jgi:hypothetical protein